MCGIEALRSYIDDAIECLIIVMRIISATQDLIVGYPRRIHYVSTL